jgi:hypothetical protein
MKKFTFLLGLFMIALIASPQNKKNLQMKIQQVHEKLSDISQKTTLVSNLISKRSLKSESNVKSAVATLKLDSTVTRILNVGSQAWQNDYNEEYIYDSELKNTFWLTKEWNLTTKTWDVSSKIELAYDNSDRINSILMHEGDSLSRIIVFYNPEGMQDSINWYSTENAGVTWTLFAKTINHYNAAKQLTNSDMWFSDEGNLVLSSTVYTYTASGKIRTSSTSLEIEDFELPSSKTEYSYDSLDRLTTVENSGLNYSTFELEKTSHTTYQYNNSGDISVEINSNWNGTSWINDNKTDYEYNTARDISVATYSKWNGDTWIADSKKEYTYGTTNFSNVAFPSYNFIVDILSSFIGLFGMEESTDVSYNKAITGINSFEMQNGSWKNTEKTVFYYSAATSTSIEETSNTLFTAYPNPASNSVNFSWKANYESLSLEMYQITGAKVIEQTTYPGKPVSISKLENGIYFFKLLNGQQLIHTGKLIKE